MTLQDFRQGLRVRYIPGHANNDRGHPDCEDGTVSSVGAVNVFVRFDKHVSRFGWEGTTSQACNPGDLISIESFIATPEIIKHYLKNVEQDDQT